MGVVRRLGDRGKLDISRDPRLPSDHSRQPITPRGQSLPTHVSDLINPITGEWDFELVKDIFWEEDAKLILALTIHVGRDNVFALHYDNKGCFSVRNACKVFTNDIIRSDKM